MSWMNSIISWLKSIELDFYDAYLVVYDWVYPFWLLMYPLLYISRAFGWLAYYFSLFNGWLVWADNEIAKILSWTAVKGLILSWLPGLETAITWFSNWWYWVKQKVDEWWNVVWSTVQYYIKIATEGLATLKVAWSDFWNITFPQWTTRLDTIASDLSNFFTVTLPTLFDIKYAEEWWIGKVKDTQLLIETALKPWIPLLESWQEVREDILKFLNDPLEFLWAKFTDWFLGPEV